MMCAPVSVKINKKSSCRYECRPYCLTAPLGSRDVIGHVTFDTPCAIFWWSFGIGIKPLSLTVCEIFNVECNAMVDVDMTLIRPLNKGRGHSFWYQSIYHRLPIGCQ